MEIFPRNSTDHVLLGIWHSANIANILRRKVLRRSAGIRCSLSTARSPPFEGRGTTVVEETGQEIQSVVDNTGGDGVHDQRRTNQRTNYESHSADAPGGMHVQQQNECIVVDAAEPDALNAKNALSGLNDTQRTNLHSDQAAADKPRGMAKSEEE